ncbi:MAG TPA: hypothetical protein PLJ62_07095 [Thermoflexales bacterium]|nr:hypothetical protein [Thermoflexales bacterium]
MQVITSKLQGRGYLTVPQIVREKLGIKQGEEVAFVIKDNGEVTLPPTTEMAQKAAELDEFFLETGIPYETWDKQSRKIRAKIFRETYPDLYKKLKEKD